MCFSICVSTSETKILSLQVSAQPREGLLALPAGAKEGSSLEGLIAKLFTAPSSNASLPKNNTGMSKGKQNLRGGCLSHHLLAPAPTRMSVRPHFGEGLLTSQGTPALPVRRCSPKRARKLEEEWIFSLHDVATPPRLPAPRAWLPLRTRISPSFSRCPHIPSLGAPRTSPAGRRHLAASPLRPAPPPRPRFPGPRPSDPPL